jgi:hypothetical protein
MRRFSSYGPVDKEVHYYAPRSELIEFAYKQLMGDNPQKDGHYITVWAPRQCGKTWTMQQILFRLQNDPRFDVLKINLEHLKYETDPGLIIDNIAKEIAETLNKPYTTANSQSQFQEIFKKSALDKPLILIMDEFDALDEVAINAIVGAFRNIYTRRMDEVKKTTEQKTYLLHAVALIGVRSVQGMFQWYEKESGQKVEPEVIKQLYKETRGQPGLTCWLGELLTEGFQGYTNDRTRSIGLKDFNFVYTAATVILPNNNILNLISKAKKEQNQTFLLEMFKTGEKLEFTFDEPTINDLYMNGLVDKELDPDGRYYLRFSSPMVQKRIFNYFSHTFFREKGQLVDPFTPLDHVITDTDLYIPNEKKYRDTLKRDARYGKQLGLPVIYLVSFVEYFDEEIAKKYEKEYVEKETGVKVVPVLIRTG